MNRLKLAFALLLCAHGLMAQSSLNQRISGQVTDSTGAALANATVSVSNQGTGLNRVTKSNETGNYVVADLPTGKYRVTAEAPGFRTQIVNGAQLNTDLSIEVNLRLQLGSRADSITVQADVAQVELGDGDVGYTVTGEQASELQLNGRNFPELLALIPGVSTTYQSSFGLFGGYGVTNDAQSVNGTRGDTITWNLGGADNKDNGGGGNNFTNINPDAIGEFRVSTSNFGASSGTSSGAVVNLRCAAGPRSSTARPMSTSATMRSRRMPSTPLPSPNYAGITSAGTCLDRYWFLPSCISFASGSSSSSGRTSRSCAPAPSTTGPYRLHRIAAAISAPAASTIPPQANSFPTTSFPSVPDRPQRAKTGQPVSQSEQRQEYVHVQ